MLNHPVQDTRSRVNRALWYIFIIPCSTGNHRPCVENHYHFPVEPFSEITTFLFLFTLYTKWHCLGSGKSRVLDC